MKDKIINNLKKFNYNFSENKSEIIVRLHFSHSVIIKISEDNKIVINDKLTHWNFLTGGIPMNLKNAMLYNFFGTIFFAMVCIYFKTKQSIFINTDLFLAYGIWIILFAGYYNLKLESFKQQLSIWTSVE